MTSGWVGGGECKALKQGKTSQFLVFSTGVLHSIAQLNSTEVNKTGLCRTFERFEAGIQMETHTPYV